MIKTGHVKRGKRTGKTLLCRLPPGMHERILSAVKAETQTLGFGMAPTSLNQIMVQGLAEYVSRWESIMASADAQYAGKVLRGARRASK